MKPGSPNRLGMLAGALLALTLAVGCGGGSKFPLHPVKGKVMYKGAAPVGAQVIFSRPGEAAMVAQPVGIVQKDGTFTVDCGKLGEGAPEGHYNIGIVWRRDTDASGNPVKMNGGVYADFFGDMYSPAAAKFQADIKPGTNELPLMELQDPPSLAQGPQMIGGRPLK